MTKPIALKIKDIVGYSEEFPNKRQSSTDDETKSFNDPFADGFNYALKEASEVEVVIDVEELANLFYEHNTGYKVGEVQPGGIDTIVMILCRSYAKALASQPQRFIRLRSNK